MLVPSSWMLGSVQTQGLSMQEHRLTPVRRLTLGVATLEPMPVSDRMPVSRPTEVVVAAMRASMRVQTQTQAAMLASQFHSQTAASTRTRST